MHISRLRQLTRPRHWYALLYISAALVACGGGGGGGDVGPLTVTAVEPADAASGVARNAQPALTFSSPVVPASVTASSVALESAAGVEAAAREVAGDRVTLKPAGRLLPLTGHVIRVTSDVVGQRGERPAGDILRRFTTADGVWREVATVGVSEDLDRPQTPLALDREGHALAAWIVRESADGVMHQVLRVSRYDAAAASWSSPMAVHPGPGDAFVPKLAMDEAGNGLLVWQHLPPATNTVPRTFSIWAARFHKASGQWEPPRRISNSASDAFWPAIAVRGNGDVAVAWAQRAPAPGADDTVWWAASTTAPGAAWQEPQRADDPTAPRSSLGGAISIALSPTGSRMALTWGARPWDPLGSPTAVWTRVFDATPAGQLPARIVSNNDGDSETLAQLAIDRAGDVHVAWRQDRPSTSGAVGTLWTVRHDASGWRERVQRTQALDNVEVLRLATNTAGAGASATWLAWVQAPSGTAPGRLRAINLGPAGGALPHTVASGSFADWQLHETGLVVDPSGNAIAAWVQTSPQVLRGARYSALSDTWSEPQLLGEDLSATAVGLTVSAVGDALLGWRGTTRDDSGVITHRPLRTRRFE